MATRWTSGMIMGSGVIDGPRRHRRFNLLMNARGSTP
jgi:hypothetical protein